MHVQVPNFGRDTYGVGKTNWGQTKNISPSCLFVPVDVILGEMYLEDAQYLNAAKKYAKYLETKFANDISSLDGVKSASVTVHLSDDTNSFYATKKDTTVQLLLIQPRHLEMIRRRVLRFFSQQQ